MVTNIDPKTADGSKNVPVGKIIAILAEEGDDISNLEVPKDEPAPPPKEEVSATPSPTPAPQAESSPSPPQSQPSSGSQAVHHDGPLFPSVHRLLLEYASSIKNPSEIKGTGIRGMITKGDVLAYLGKASGPLGSYAGKEPKPEMATASFKGAAAAKPEVAKVRKLPKLL